MSNFAENNKNFCIELSFDGTDFAGWQSQPNGQTVQDIVEDRLLKLYSNKKIRIHGSGRTDRGVHSLGMVASYAPPSSPEITTSQVRKALNGLLPSSVRVISVTEVSPDFHARFSARGKAYTYVINRGNATPFSSRYSWSLYNFTELKEIKKAAGYLTGTHDFASFAVKSKKKESTVRTIYSIELQEFGDLLCFTFKGSGFLYKMIRSIMGTFAAVGTGKINAQNVKEFLGCKDRSVSEKTAPPQGLFLMKVFYNENEWKRFRLETPPFYV